MQLFCFVLPTTICYMCLRCRDCATQALQMAALRGSLFQLQASGTACPLQRSRCSIHTEPTVINQSPTCLLKTTFEIPGCCCPQGFLKLQVPVTHIRFPACKSTPRLPLGPPCPLWNIPYAFCAVSDAFHGCLQKRSSQERKGE
jgi:hypothetical protein